MVNDQQDVVVTDTAVSTVPTVNRAELIGVSKMLKVLSSADALIIFSMTKDGIEADTFTYSKIGLTRKQYYVRLMQLKDAGLIEKKDNTYFQTTMGSFLQENCINTVAHAVKNSKKMAMIDVLKRNDKFSEEDLCEMKMAVQVQ